jgi:iron-sulfur cluster assembly protein
MFDVSREARNKAAAFFAGREIQPIRVYVSTDGERRSFALALDRARSGDAVFELDGLTYVINQAFLNHAQPVRIDHGAGGFKISASIDPNAGTCATCQAAGKCGH